MQGLFSYTFFGITLLMGGLILRFIPVRRNLLFGYRTFRSLKTAESWKYANATSGKYSIVIGSASVLFGIICYALNILDYEFVIVSTLGIFIFSHVIIEIQLFRKRKNKEID